MAEVYDPVLKAYVETFETEAEAEAALAARQAGGVRTYEQPFGDYVTRTFEEQAAIGPDTAKPIPWTDQEIQAWNYPGGAPVRTGVASPGVESEIVATTVAAASIGSLGIGEVKKMANGNGYSNGVQVRTGAPAPPEGIRTFGPVLGAIGGAVAPYLPGIIGGVLGGGVLGGIFGGGGGGGGGAGPDPSLGLQGPGVPEPRPGTYTKSWRTTFERKGTPLNGYVWFWKMLDGSVIYYSTSGKAGRYKPKKPIAVIMAGGATKLSQAVRAQRSLDRLWRTVAKRTKQLKLA